ncbi:MAG: TAXI family TRAP transporter solute-binding subunit, partial [Vicinamibacterales bacterium]
GAVTRLSIATGNTGGVYYPYGGGLAKVISASIPGVEATAEATNASVDNLKLLQQGQVDIAFSLADTLSDAVGGKGPFASAKVPVQTLAVLYPNYTHLATVEGRGIERIADLKGKTVSTGSPSSGTEVIAVRMMQAAGLDPDKDIRRQSLSVNASVDAIKDGKIDAFFWSGGLPTGSILDLASTIGVTARLVPNDDVLARLQSTFGASLYTRLVIPAGTYPGVTVDVPVVAVANALVVSASMPEPLAYDLTRVLFEKKADLAAIHAEAAKLDLTSALNGSPASFHPGAIRFYKERGVWKE